LAQIQVRRRFQNTTHFSSVKAPVRLGARRLDSRPSGTVKQAELDSRSVDNPAHYAAEGIYLPDNMTFSDTADRRIARHLTDQVKIYRHESRPGP
jgi:hypothetical protein